MKKPDIMLIPGNGGSHIATDHWYAWVRDNLTTLGLHVIAHDMPDPVVAHKNIWLPHIIKELVPNQDAIIIGHSSGAVAVLRYLELHKLTGAILVGCNYTDLGDEGEKESGWYKDPWLWDKIKENAGWIEQFHSLDDPYIPVTEPRQIHEQIGSTYHEFSDRGHFMIEHNSINNTFPEIIGIISAKKFD
jgi:predicted alpha/beta hydrolase family esterase